MPKYRREQLENLADTLTSSNDGGFGYTKFIDNKKHDYEEIENYYEENLSVIEIDKDGNFTNNSKEFENYCATRVLEDQVDENKPIFYNIDVINERCNNLKLKVLKNAKTPEEKFKLISKDTSASTDKIKANLERLASIGLPVKIKYFADNGQQKEIVYGQNNEESKEAFNKIKYATYNKVTSNKVYDKNEIIETYFYGECGTKNKEVLFNNVQKSKMDLDRKNNIAVGNLRIICDSLVDLNDIKYTVPKRLEYLDITYNVFEKVMKDNGITPNYYELATEYYQDTKQAIEKELEIDNEIDAQENSENLNVNNNFEFNNQPVKYETKEQVIAEANRLQPTLLNDKKATNRAKFVSLFENYLVCKNLCGDNKKILKQIVKDLMPQLNKLKISNIFLGLRGLKEDYALQQEMLKSIKEDLEPPKKIIEEVKQYKDGKYDIDLSFLDEDNSLEISNEVNNDSKQLDIPEEDLNKPTTITKPIDPNQNKNLEKEPMGIDNNN